MSMSNFHYDQAFTHQVLNTIVINVNASMIKKYCHGLKAYSGIVTLIIASICVVTTKVLDATLASHPSVDIQPDAYERTSSELAG